MANIDSLSNQAISSASQGKWEEAKTYNEQIIELEPQNIAALNRLAFCHMQLENFTEAKKLYSAVLELEKFNAVANKYLSILKQKDKPIPKVSSLLYQDFIEEPGKTRSVALQRLADPDILQSVPTGTICSLVARNHRINVQTGKGTYLGCLPDDIAFRLLKLLSSGNTYMVAVQSTTKKNCVVFIKETHRSKDCPYATSFPLGNSQRISLQEDVLLDEVPLDTRETGNEGEEFELTEEPGEPEE